jgi:flagellar hook-associated protein 3 FlgL
MKISTSYFYDRAVDQMGEAQSKVSALQAKVAAGKQVLTPSDDPAQASDIQRLKGLVQRQESNLRTLDRVESRLSLEESALQSVTDALTRMRELIMQASNDTQTPDTRAAIGIELKALRDEVASIANTKTVEGDFIFSGGKTSTEPFGYDSSGKVSYQGDQSRRAVLVGDGLTIELGRSGSDVFRGVVRSDTEGMPYSVGFFAALDDMVSGVKSGDHQSMQRAVSELDSLQLGISLSLGEVGAQMNRVDSQRTRVDDTKLRIQALLSGKEDLDYATAISEMSKQILALEAAQGSFAKISSLSLFNYIK